MKKNMGITDKMVRTAIAVIIALLCFGHAVTGVAAIILLSLAAIFIVTSLLGFCPLYLPFGICTSSKEDDTGHKVA